jgi:outer membrane lipase/esterase
MKFRNYAAIALACALVACGGGGGNSGVNKTTVSSVKVVGASLADSGTFSYKFTVQPSSTYPLVYPERIAATFGAPALCPKFLYNGTTFVANTSASCSGFTNYAVAGASVGNYKIESVHAYLPSSSPTSMLMQMSAMGAGGFTDSDLVIVGEGPANDVATLASAYLAQSPANSSDFVNIMTGTGIPALLGLDGTTVTTLLGSASGRAQLGHLYMQKMASQVVASIQSNMLARGATRVAVLNVLDVTYTPKFQLALAAVAQANGATAASNFRALVQDWVQAYNTQLTADVAALNTNKVVIVDFYTNFTAEMNDPAQYGLTNVSATVCDELYSASTSTTTTVVTAGTTSLATAPTIPGICTTTAASALTPQHSAVNGADWWKTYLFADNFHPTPYGHQLLAQLVAKRLTEAGWL